MTKKINTVNPINIDKIDEKILESLKENSKIQLRNLAGKLGVSFVTVMNRIKRLEASEVIRGYSTVIDYSKLGYDVFCEIDLRISKGKLIELEKRIANHKNVFAVYDTTGDFDATVLCRFKNTRDLDKFVKEIQTYDFVERTNTKLILNRIKEEM